MNDDATSNKNRPAVVEQDRSSLDWQIPIIICGALLLCYSSVLFNIYLRQDDLAHPLWNRSNILSHGDIFTFVINEFRPLSVPVLLMSEAINYHMEWAWITRLINTLLIGFSAVLCYRWQRKFDDDKVFCASFAICAATTQGFEIIAATGQYTVMILSLICIEVACFEFYKGFVNKNYRFRCYACGIGMMFVSFLSYPLASTYVFAFAFIYLMHDLDERWSRGSFIFHLTSLALISMGALFLLAKIVYLAVPPISGRSVVIDWDIANKLEYWYVMLYESFNFFVMDWFLASAWKVNFTYQPMLVSIAIFLAGIAVWQRRRSGATRGRSKILAKGAVALVVALTLGFVPALAIHYNYSGRISLRYELVILPIALYAVFWGTRELARWSAIFATNQRISQGFCVVTVAALLLCGHNVSRYVAGLFNFEFDCLRNGIKRQVLPLIEAGTPVTIHVRESDHPALPGGDGYAEYGGIGMSNLAPGTIMAAVIYVMREFGYEVVETDPTASVVEWNDRGVLLKIKWGYIYAASPELHQISIPQGTKEVFIDMNDCGSYW